MAKAVSTEPVKRVRKSYEEKLAELQTKHEAQVAKDNAKAEAGLEKLELRILKAETTLADLLVERDEYLVTLGRGLEVTFQDQPVSEDAEV